MSRERKVDFICDQTCEEGKVIWEQRGGMENDLWLLQCLEFITQTLLYGWEESFTISITGVAPARNKEIIFNFVKTDNENKQSTTAYENLVWALLCMLCTGIHMYMMSFNEAYASASCCFFCV